MKKTIPFLFAFLLAFAGFAQGHETFDNLETEGNSYADGSFTGQDGSTWNYLQARGDADTEVYEEDQAIMLGRNRTPDAELTSGTLSNGIGTLQFSYKKAFGTDVNLEVYINDDLVYTATTDGEDEAITTEEIAVNVDGDFTLKFFNPSGAGQVNIDDIIWTATGDDPTLSIISPSNDHQYAPGEVPSIHFNITNFSISTDSESADGDGYIQYQVNDGDFEDYFSTDDIVLDDLEAGDYDITLQLVDNDGEETGISDNLTFSILEFEEVSNLAELREAELNGYYTLTGEVILTYQQDFRNQKYIQDETGAILIDDDGGVIETLYNQYDGITGISGKLTENSGLLQLQPTADPGDATSGSNNITPIIITIPELMDTPEAYESQIIAIENIEFDLEEGENVFETGYNYTVVDEDGNSTIMRTNFFDADYIGEEIPVGVQDVVVGIAARFYDDGQFFIRDTDDLEGTPMSTNTYKQPEISLYPNPAKDKLHITLKGEAKVYIYSLIGQNVLQASIKDQATFDIGSLPSGIYLVKISQEQKLISKKLIVE